MHLILESNGNQVPSRKSFYDFFQDRFDSDLLTLLNVTANRYLEMVILIEHLKNKSYLRQELVTKSKHFKQIKQPLSLQIDDVEAKLTSLTSEIQITKDELISCLEGINNKKMTKLTISEEQKVALSNQLQVFIRDKITHPSARLAAAIIAVDIVSKEAEILNSYKDLSQQLISDWENRYVSLDYFKEQLIINQEKETFTAYLNDVLYSFFNNVSLVNENNIITEEASDLLLKDKDIMNIAYIIFNQVLSKSFILDTYNQYIAVERAVRKDIHDYINNQSNLFKDNWRQSVLYLFDFMQLKLSLFGIEPTLQDVPLDDGKKLNK